MGNFKFSQRSKDRMKGVDPRLIEIAELALNISIIDFGIPNYGGARTKEEQYDLFVSGKSKADGITKFSMHQPDKSGFSRALDVYAYVDNKASWETEHLSLVACAMLQAASLLGHKLQWGGLWTSFKDMPHFQLKE